MVMCKKCNNLYMYSYFSFYFRFVLHTNAIPNVLFHCWAFQCLFSVSAMMKPYCFS